LENSTVSGDYRHQLGAYAETIAAQILIKNGFYVFIPLRKTGPVDIFAIHEDGRQLKLDIKAESWRKPSALRPTRTRIYRSLSPVQKRLGVQIGYVSVEHQLLYVCQGNGCRPIRME
jgi:hypothetical protein